MASIGSSDSAMLNTASVLASSFTGVVRTRTRSPLTGSARLSVVVTPRRAAANAAA